MSRAREIVVISAPRSGTNYFCDTMGTFSGVLPLFEIFNPGGVFGLNRDGLALKVADAAGLDAKDAKEKPLRRYFRQSPIQALDTLTELAAHEGYQFVSYKIFPRQLSDDFLDHLLSDQRRTVVFLARRRLDTCISYKKAQVQEVWAQKDTTAIKPDLPFNQFLYWARRFETFFQGCYQRVITNGLEHCILDYDLDVVGNRTEVLRTLNRRLVKAGVSLKEDWRPSRSRFSQQDKTIDPFARIQGGDDLKAELIERGYLEYALDTPLSDERLQQLNGVG